MSKVKQTYSLRIANTSTSDLNVCLFEGNIPTLGMTADTAPVLTRGLVSAVNNYGLGAIDAIMIDGLSPGKDGKTPTTGIKSTSLVTGRSIANFKEHLRSNSYLVERLSIISQTASQMSNPINIGESVPTAYAKEERTITPDNQITDKSFQDNRAEFTDVNIWLQDDTLIYMKVNAGEIVTLTFTFTEEQK